MANLRFFVVGVLLVMSMLHSVSDAKRNSWHLRTLRRLNFVPAVRASKFAESACLPTPNMRNGMYVAVPQILYDTGHACNKTLRVSCAEPYRDLGGPWEVCRTGKIFNLTVIDQVLDNPLDDNLFHLSEKAFKRMAYPGVDSIRLIIHR